MNKTLTCRFSVADWQENEQWQQSDHCRMCTANIKYHYEGDITGESRAQMDILYYPNGDSHFVALEHIDAEIDGKRGGLVLQHTGTHSEKVASGRCELVFGTGELADLRGSGHYEATSSEVALVITLK